MIGLLLAAGTSLFVTLIGTRFLIDWLRARQIGQPIHEDVPSGHTTKAGTPTMGGVVIVARRVPRLHGRAPPRGRDLHPLRHPRRSSPSPARVWSARSTTGSR